MIIKIDKKLVNNIFGQYEGTYLSEEKRSVKINQEGKENQTITLSKGSKCTIDFILNADLKEDNIVDISDSIIHNYAKNPDNGLVVIVTGRYKVI